ncbi:exopolysaccharide biosynthesis protein [Sinorhizobium sp. BG8]|uniref:exopolysaccharide biosynthesis protein n=1 Tax=Sinorhizobium sp. BG8 TaxID=2613773 RepID=UPI00193CD80A|nr:exopolysaccharide biosynthesis protein [Sinorhizobium sp. BG8]QRM56686.1 exopolysaccharide biosynthesis protein [Sinorhizobium sp. BG8]
MRDIQFNDTIATTSSVLESALDNIDGEHVTLRDLISVMGEQGLLLLCALLSLPFLFPVSIPGVSTAFGAGIVLISAAITANRIPWLPSAVADRQIQTSRLKPTLERGLGLLRRIERYVMPRMPALTNGILMNRINGLAMMAAGLLLMLPLSFIPFSNTLPAVAVLLFSAGISQRDGLIVAGGFAMVGLTVVYFGVLAYLAVSAGQNLL